MIGRGFASAERPKHPQVTQREGLPAACGNKAPLPTSTHSIGFCVIRVCISSSSSSSSATVAVVRTDRGGLYDWAWFCQRRETKAPAKPPRERAHPHHVGTKRPCPLLPTALAFMLDGFVIGRVRVRQPREADGVQRPEKASGFLKTTSSIAPSQLVLM